MACNNGSKKFKMIIIKLDLEVNTILLGRKKNSIAMLLIAKPSHLQQPWLPSTIPNRTRFNSRRRIIILNNSNENNNNSSYPPLVRKRNRYRKLYPGETTGITEEMRFVAMKLHNDETNTLNNTTSVVVEDAKGQIPDTWCPSMKGFLRFLVDNQLVFATLERIVDDSDNVSCKFNNSLQLLSVCLVILYGRQN